MQRQCNSYPRQNEPRIIHDLLQCCHRFPDLKPIVDLFSFHETREKHLVALVGNLQIAKENSYCECIPFRIWIMPYYPKGPPLVFVSPGNFLTKRRNHPHVDHDSGLVYTPYLSRWCAHSSSVIGTVESSVDALTALFVSQPSSVVTPVVHRDNRYTLVTFLTQRISAAFAERYSLLMETVTVLQCRKQSLLSDRQKLHTQSQLISKTAWGLLSTRRSQLENRRDELFRWWEGKPGIEGYIGLDKCLQPLTMEHHQEITCKATDSAAEDVLDQLDEVLYARLIPMDDYINTIRRLAREQFYARALLMKLNASQSVVQTVPSAFSKISRQDVEYKSYSENRISVQKAQPIDSGRSLFGLCRRL